MPVGTEGEFMSLFNWTKKVVAQQQAQAQANPTTVVQQTTVTVPAVVGMTDAEYQQLIVVASPLGADHLIQQCVDQKKTYVQSLEFITMESAKQFEAITNDLLQFNQPQGSGELPLKPMTTFQEAMKSAPGKTQQEKLNWVKVNHANLIVKPILK